MEFKKVLILTVLFMLAGLGGMFIGSGIEKDSTQTKQKVKKVVVHDTVYVSNSFETYNLPKCEGALIDSLVIDKRKITTDGVPEGGWTVPTQKYYKGKALITSLTRNDPNGDNSSMSISLQGVGKLERIDA
mgnify:CR=1 FL=1